MMKKESTFAALIVLSPSALAGNWGDSWGTMTWGATAASNAAPVPVDSIWMLVATSFAVALIGTLRARKK